MARSSWWFFVIAAFLLITVSGQSNNVKSVAVLQVMNCTENEICEPATRKCQQTDEEGNCMESSCPDGQELDPNTGECRELSNCEGGPCGEMLQKMKDNPKKLRSKKGFHIALILKKKKKLMKPFLKPKPHHDHHHHSTEEEEEEEEEDEEPIPGPDDAPEAPGLRLFNDEICVERENGTVGKCINSTEPPKTSGVANGIGTVKRRKKRMGTRKEKPASQADPAEANVRKKFIRFLKVLRMRRQLNPVVGRLFQRNNRKVSPEEKMKK